MQLYNDLNKIKNINLCFQKKTPKLSQSRLLKGEVQDLFPQRWLQAPQEQSRTQKRVPVTSAPLSV